MKTETQIKNRKHSAHTHIYAAHPRMEDRQACAICGFSIANELLPLAIKQGARTATPEERVEVRRHALILKLSEIHRELNKTHADVTELCSLNTEDDTEDYYAAKKVVEALAAIAAASAVLTR